MLKVLRHLVLGLFLVSFAVAPVFGFGGGSMSTAESGTPAVTGKMKALSVLVRQAGTDELLEVPLFSEKYSQLPLATVDEEPITLKEFSIELASMHGSMTGSDSPGSQSLTKLLDRLITIKLIKQEALNIGFDRTPAVQKKIEKFYLTTLIKQLLAEQITDITMTDADTEELYQQMAIEAKLLTYLFPEQADAEAVLAGSKAGGDFKALAEELRANKKAEKAEDPEYVRLTELLPAIANAVYSMEKGAVSEIFKKGEGHLLFQLEDKRVYEDPEVRLAAASQLIQQKSKKMQMEYLESLFDKYAVFDEEAEATLDFVKIAEENPSAKGTEVFSRLNDDKRPLVTISDGRETVVITVADMAEKIQSTLYHGMDKAINGPTLNKSKETTIWNSVVAVVGRMEAQAQGIDQFESFIDQVESFKTQVLFDTFVAKAVVPGIAVPEDEAKTYYFNHLEEYASPLMLKMKSLPFADDASARDALKKLQDGSDFKWVSSNMTGLADAENKDILNLGGTLLSVNALPGELQPKVSGARQGDVIYYAGPNELSYVLVVETAFPPKAKAYEEVRQEIGKIIYAQKIDEALKGWVVKLKEAYETKVFLVEG